MIPYTTILPGEVLFVPSKKNKGVVLMIVHSMVSFCSFSQSITFPSIAICTLSAHNMDSFWCWNCCIVAMESCEAHDQSHDQSQFPERKLESGSGCKSDWKSSSWKSGWNPPLIMRSERSTYEMVVSVFVWWGLAGAHDRHVPIFFFLISNGGSLSSYIFDICIILSVVPR